MQEIEVIVSGKVHGVSYRAFVKQKAKALWLSGFVENIPDYRVRVVAQGSKEKLKGLIEHLHKGPFTSKVSNASVTWREPKEQYDDFSIRY